MRGAQSKERFAESQKEGRLLTLNDQVAHLFPTPKATDADKGTRTTRGALTEASRGHGIDLPSHVQIFPTPRAADGMTHPLRNPQNIGNPRGRLEDYVALLPTPICNDAKNNNPPSQRTENGRHSNQLNVIAGGSLNPLWVEWLMGFPPGWTDLSGEESPTFLEQPAESRTACHA
jgi:hypothetical protein